MAKLHLDLEKKTTQTNSKIQLARLDLKELFMADKPDKGAVEKQIKVISDLQHQQKLNHIDHLFAVRDILTPEQQKMWKEHAGGMLMGADGPRGGARMRMHERIIEE